MVAVREIPWEEASAPGFEQTTRQAWREAVAEIAEKARAKLPDGTARVASQSSSSTTYHIVNGHCDCRDYEKAPHSFCKHRLSAAIARRAQELVKVKLRPEPAQPQSTPASLPEAPVSITLKASLHGHEVLVTLRGTDFASVKAQVEQASQWLKLQAPAQRQPAGTEQGWCGKHGVAMKLNHGKNGSTWYSHMTVDGWCKGK
jgi:hypothetical protein